MQVRLLLAPLALAAAAVVTVRASAPVTDLVDRAPGYVCRYVHEFSSVVAEERYVQDSHPMPRVDAFGSGAGSAQPAQHVELRSDLLFVTPAPSTDWLTFRDVFSVNGREVRDRAFRLVKLFVDAPSDMMERVSAIARDGYRYNIGSKDRTLANPMLALALLQPQYRDRFEYKVVGVDTSRGPDVWIVKFKERVRPTILRTPDDRNVSSMGRFWVEGSSGRVLQTELETSVGDKVMTTFVFDERLQVDVPAEMRDISWADGTVVTGVAAYSNFRHFDVATDEKFR